MFTKAFCHTATKRTCPSWFDCARPEMITNSIHHFLDQFGQFPTIAEMTRTGSATVVLASGALKQVTAERTPFCADVAPLFERAMGQGEGAGNAAVKVGERNGWASEAVEGEGWRGYGAGSVMGRGRKTRFRVVRSVHMWTVWKLTKSQGAVKSCSSDLRGNVHGSIRVGRQGMARKVGSPCNMESKTNENQWGGARLLFLVSVLALLTPGFLFFPFPAYANADPKDELVSSLRPDGLHRHKS